VRQIPDKIVLVIWYYVENKKYHFFYSCPVLQRAKLQQESTSSILFWIPACAGMTPLFSWFVDDESSLWI
jgi:hypothetical protein